MKFAGIFFVLGVSFVLLSPRAALCADDASDSAYAPAESLSQAVTSSASTNSVTPQAPQRFAVGLGYPDVRTRVALAYGLDAEAKFAFEQGIQVYTGRLYWNFFTIKACPLKLLLGAEGGYGHFNAAESLDGGGPAYGGFFGLEYPFERRFSLLVDAGPYKVQVAAEGYSYQTTQLVFNTALYVYLF
jgi:hypothetical protein